MSRVSHKIRFKGVWTRFRIDRETGELLGVDQAENAIVTDGLNLFMDLLSGLSTNSMTNGNSIIELVLSSGTENITGNSADSGFPDHSIEEGRVRWEWSDISTDEYTIDTLNIYQANTDIATDGIQVSSTSNPFADNSKPESENWIYRYDITMSGSGGLQSAGMDRCLRIITDNEDNVFGGPASGETGNLALKPHDTAGTDACASPDRRAADTGFPSRSSQTVTWEYTIADGDCDGDWTQVDMISMLWTGTTDVVLSAGNTDRGTKTAGEEWQFTYDLTGS